MEVHLLLDGLFPGKSHKNGWWFRATPILGNLQISTALLFSGKCIAIEIHLLSSSCHYHALFYQQKNWYRYNDLRLPHEIPNETLSHFKLQSSNQSRSTKVDKDSKREEIKEEWSQSRWFKISPKQKTIAESTPRCKHWALRHWGPTPNPNPRRFIAEQLAKNRCGLNPPKGPPLGSRTDLSWMQLLPQQHRQPPHSADTYSLEPFPHNG